MESITDLKWTLARRNVLGTIVAMMYVWKVVIPCSMMLVVVHAKQLYYRVIYNFHLSIYLRMEGCRQRNSCVELFLESFPKGTDKYRIYVRNYGCQKAIMLPNMFEEEMRSLLRCHSIFSWYEYSHLGKYVDYY